MDLILPILQIVVAVTLIILILLQQGESGLGSAFGQAGSYSARRGLQRHVFTATIVFSILFVVLALLNLIV